MRPRLQIFAIILIALGNIHAKTLTSKWTLHLKESCPDPEQEQPFKRSEFVGLRNIGKTSFANSILQIMFHLKPFRELIYKSGIKSGASNETESKPVLNAFSELFLQLEYSSCAAISPKKFLDIVALTLGQESWDTDTELDAAGFSTWIFDKLNAELQDDPKHQSELRDLFRVETTRTELRLGVTEPILHHDESINIMLDTGSELKNLHDAIRHSLGPTVQGNSTYRNQIVSLPPILSIVLLRFDNTGRKSFCGMEYSNSTILDEFVQGFNDSGQTETVPSFYDYNLFAVLVHEGKYFHGGHNVAYFSPRLDQTCNTFRDENVTEECWGQLAQECYGELEESQKKPLTNTAVVYMLYYVRNDVLTRNGPNFERVWKTFSNL